MQRGKLSMRCGFCGNQLQHTRQALFVECKKCGAQEHRANTSHSWKTKRLPTNQEVRKDMERGI